MEDVSTVTAADQRPRWRSARPILAMQENRRHSRDIKPRTDWKDQSLTKKISLRKTEQQHPPINAGRCVMYPRPTLYR